MASAEERRKAPERRETTSGTTTTDPVHQHGPGDVSTVMEGGEENPKDHHPSNAETVGVKRILRYSTLAAIVAMVVVGIIAFSAFS